MGSEKAHEGDVPDSAKSHGKDDAVSATEMPQSAKELEELLSPRLAEQKRLVDVQNNARSSIGTLCYQALGELILTIDVTQGIIADVFHRLDGKRWSSEDNILNRHLLLASFASSMDVTKVLTIEGLYVPAATLVRQQMECLAELETIESGKTRRKDKTAHVGALRWRLAKAYGSLSGIAHNSQEKLFELFAEQPDAASVPEMAAATEEGDRPLFNIGVYPRFIEWKASQLLSQQACHALITAAHALCFMQDVSNEVVSDGDAALIKAIGKSLEVQGIVELADESA